MRAFGPLLAFAVAITLALGYTLVVIPPEFRGVLLAVAGLVGVVVALDAIDTFRCSVPVEPGLRCRHCGVEVVENTKGIARTHVPYFHADVEHPLYLAAGPHPADPHEETTR